MEFGGRNHAQAPLFLGEKNAVFRCRVGLVGRRASLDRYGEEIISDSEKSNR